MSLSLAAANFRRCSAVFFPASCALAVACQLTFAWPFSWPPEWETTVLAFGLVLFLAITGTAVWTLGFNKSTENLAKDELIGGLILFGLGWVMTSGSTVAMLRGDPNLEIKSWMSGPLFLTVGIWLVDELIKRIMRRSSN